MKTLRKCERNASLCLEILFDIPLESLCKVKSQSAIIGERLTFE